MKLIGFSGKAGSGKDTAARGLAKHLWALGQSSDLFAFAGPLKDVATILWNLRSLQAHGSQKEIVDPRWGIAPRQMLQDVGTMVRNALGRDHWIRLLDRRLDAASQLDVVMITDVRYLNEARWIHRQGGKVYRIERPDRQEIGTPSHPSETEMDYWDGFDGVIANNGTLTQFRQKVVEAVL